MRASSAGPEGKFSEDRSSTKRLFRLATLGLVIGVGLFAAGMAEWILRVRERQIRQSDRLEPGLLRHDSILGWRLVSHASVRHRHHDFDVRYTVNAQGFRADAVLSDPRTKPLCLVIGDSFTFGFGVNDSETFVHHLNQSPHAKTHFLNCSVPAYSTDQEALLIERELLKLKPDEIWLVVYLGNDLLDNQHPFPLQATLPKPYFTLENGELRAHNTPVPPQHAAPVSQPRDQVTEILGSAAARRGGVHSILERSALLRGASQRFLPSEDYSAALEAQAGPSLALFRALVARVRAACSAASVKLRLILMPGRSFVEQPSSLSGQYQEFLRRQLVRDSAGIEVFDLAEKLRQRSAKAGERWFHPNEGHLNPAGHKVVAELLLESDLR